MVVRGAPPPSRTGFPDASDKARTTPGRPVSPVPLLFVSASTKPLIDPGARVSKTVELVGTGDSLLVAVAVLMIWVPAAGEFTVTWNLRVSEEPAGRVQPEARLGGAPSMPGTPAGTV